MVKLANWMIKNPHVNVKSYQRGSRPPFLICNHENNFLQRKGKPIDWSIPLNNKSPDQIENYFNFINNSAGGKAKKITERFVVQQKPTIQGFWTPDFQKSI